MMFGYELQRRVQAAASRPGRSVASRPQTTEEGLESETLYGPTQRADTVGAIDACVLEEHALNQVAAIQLWALSEEKTSLTWSP